MIAVLRKCHGVDTGEVNSKHSRLSGSQLQTNPNLHRRTRCLASIIAAGMPIKMTMGNQIPPVTMAILTSLQTINVGRSLEVKESL